MSAHRFARSAPLLGIALAVPLALPAASGASQPAPVPVALRATAPTLALAAGAQPFLAGLTSQDMPVLLRFSKDHSILTRAVTTMHLKCTTGNNFWTPDGFTNLTVSSTRTFRPRYELPPQPAGDGSTMLWSGALNGKVDRTGTRASGTWQITLVVKDTTTAAVTDTCTTGAVRFSAHS